ncbi:hypothetical protein ACFQVA_27330 [Actinomadura keratinilytica]
MNRIDDGADGPGGGRPPAAPHVHDPFEVTIQMDGIGRHLEGARRPRGAHAKPQPRPLQEPADGPVFVDESSGAAATCGGSGWPAASPSPGTPWWSSPRSSPATPPRPGCRCPARRPNARPPSTPRVCPRSPPAPRKTPATRPCPPTGPPPWPGRARPRTPRPAAPAAATVPWARRGGRTPARTPSPRDLPGRPGPQAHRHPGARHARRPPTQSEQPPAESEDPPGEPETPPGDGGGAVPQARRATTAPPTVHTLARTAPPEENQAA